MFLCTFPPVISYFKGLRPAARRTRRASTVTKGVASAFAGAAPVYQGTPRDALFGNAVVFLLGGKAVIWQSLGFEQVQGSRAAGIVNEACFMHYLEANKDIVMPVAGVVQQDKVFVHYFPSCTRLKRCRLRKTSAARWTA